MNRDDAAISTLATDPKAGIQSFIFSPQIYLGVSLFSAL